MKTFLLFVGIFSAILLEICTEDTFWGKEEDDCVIELNLDRTVMQAINKHNITPEHNTDFNSFLGCYWEKTGKLTTDGDINWQLIDESLVKEFQNLYQADPELNTVLAEEMVLHAAASCREDNIVGDSHGQKVARLRNCIRKKIQKAIDDFEKTVALSHNLFVKLF